MLFPCPVLLGVVLNHVPHRPPHCSRNLSLIPIFCRTFFASPEVIPFTFISSTARLRRVFVHLAPGRFRHLHFLLSHCLPRSWSVPSSSSLLIVSSLSSSSSHPCPSRDLHLLPRPVFSRSSFSHSCQAHHLLPSSNLLSVLFFTPMSVVLSPHASSFLSVFFFAPLSDPSSSFLIQSSLSLLRTHVSPIIFFPQPIFFLSYSSHPSRFHHLPIESSLGLLLLSTHVSPIIVFLPHPILVESLFILPHVFSNIFFPPHPVFSWSSSSHPSQYHHLIRGSRVRIPAGSAGKCSSPGSTFSADFYFGIRSPAVLSQ